MWTRILFSIVALAATLCFGCEAVAQSDSALDHRRANLKQLSDTLKQRSQSERARAHVLARSNGIPVRSALPGGGVFELQRFTPDGAIFYITDNIGAADTVSTDEVWPGGSTSFNLTGSGMTVGEWDAGAVKNNHIEFDSRVTQMEYELDPLHPTFADHDHSTHVAGTMIAAGLDPDARGMASAANLKAWNWEDDASEMAAAAADPDDPLLYSNHSYGIAAGWFNLNSPECNNWWWMGGETAIEDYKFGFYDSDASTWDQIAYTARDYLIVKSAGNDRSDTGPGLNGPHCVLSADESELTPSTLSRNSDCLDGIHPPGYDCLPTISVAKNILTVGAVGDIIDGYDEFAGPTSVSMTTFSGWGPTDDGRIKPDLVANGLEVYSTVENWCLFDIFCFDYNIFSGTSMAAPNTTGSLVLLRQLYQETHGDTPMHSATLKALVIHTTNEAGPSDGPDYKFGWGLLNIRKAAEVIDQDGLQHRIIEASLASGATNITQINVNEPESTIRATLVWTDPPGTPVAPSIDPTNGMLVNDLDLRIRHASTTRQPWVLDPASPELGATRGDNFRDNVEQVVIGTTGPGAYFVEVSHKGVLLDSDDQDFSLIISVDPPTSNGTTNIVDEDFNGGLPSGWMFVDNSQDELGPDWAIYTPVIGDPEFDNRTGGNGQFAMVHYGALQGPFDAELRTDSYNLSAHSEVSLEFKSHFEHFFFEQISVDISIDGGLNWTENIWMHEYSALPGPTTQVMDITGLAAHQANVMIRFQFQSVNALDGILWQIDDVKLRVPAPLGVSDPCAGEYNLPADQWRLISIPCNPDAPGTVSDIFGDDLDDAEYGTSWILYSRDEVNSQYFQIPDVSHNLEQGKGYFLLSMYSDLLEVHGTSTILTNSADCTSPDGLCYEIPLMKPADSSSEHASMLGHPLPIPVTWADFRLRVLDDQASPSPVPGSPFTPAEAEAAGFMANVVHKYSGSAYLPFDDVTPGFNHGALGAYDGFWLKTLGGSQGPGIGTMTLLVPNIRATGIITSAAPGPMSSTVLARNEMMSQNSRGQSTRDKSSRGKDGREGHARTHVVAQQENQEWYVRLTIEAPVEQLRDDANILGQLLDSQPGFDQHDLPEPAPFTPYLTVIFEQGSWGEHAADYTSDFHAITGEDQTDEWTFVVRSDDPEREVTLSWDSAEDVFSDSQLIDLHTNRTIKPGKQRTYTFVMDGESREFRWVYKKHPEIGDDKDNRKRKDKRKRKRKIRGPLE